MKLIKYIIFVLVLVGSLIFLLRLNTLNSVDGITQTVKIPFIYEEVGKEFDLWIVMLGTLTAGVFIGFIIALFQIISQKSENISYRSRLKRLQNELDNLRNESIDDDIELKDDIDSKGF